jgi:hypothetical protein
VIGMASADLELQMAIYARLVADAGVSAMTFHGWSREVGFPEVKRLAAAVKDALHLAPIVLDNWRLVSINHRGTRVFRDQDGLSSHAVIDFAAFVEKQ